MFLRGAKESATMRHCTHFCGVRLLSIFLFKKQVKIHGFPKLKSTRLKQACTTYGPRELFLLPARACFVEDNVAESRLGIINCRSRISSKLLYKEVSLQRNEINFCGAQQTYVNHFGPSDFLNCARLVSLQQSRFAAIPFFDLFATFY